MINKEYLILSYLILTNSLLLVHYVTNSLLLVHYVTNSLLRVHYVTNLLLQVHYVTNSLLLVAYIMFSKAHRIHEYITFCRIICIFTHAFWVRYVFTTIANTLSASLSKNNKDKLTIVLYIKTLWIKENCPATFQVPSQFSNEEPKCKHLSLITFRQTQRIYRDIYFTQSEFYVQGNKGLRHEILWAWVRWIGRTLRADHTVWVVNVMSNALWFATDLFACASEIGSWNKKR